jgi:hypothetical protein
MASASKSRVLRRRAKRTERGYLQSNTVAAACGRFLRDRGLNTRRADWNRAFMNEEPKTDGL